MDANYKQQQTAEKQSLMHAKQELKAENNINNTHNGLNQSDPPSEARALKEDGMSAQASFSHTFS